MSWEQYMRPIWDIWQHLLLMLRAAPLPSERTQWQTCKLALNSQAMRKQQLTAQTLSKKERIRQSDVAGRDFGDKLDRTRVRGERPGSCTRSNFQAKSTLLSILPTVALTEPKKIWRTTEWSSFLNCCSYHIFWPHKHKTMSVRSWDSFLSSSIILSIWCTVLAEEAGVCEVHLNLISVESTFWVTITMATFDAAEKTQLIEMS